MALLWTHRTLFKPRMLGFSYVEMVFAVAMLAMLAAVATPYLEKHQQRKKETELKQSLREIRTAIDAYKAAYDKGKFTKLAGESGYPKQLEDLVNGVEDVTDPQKKKLRFLRRIPIDPMYARILNSINDPKNSVNPADTWGKRSYDSDADAPKEGRDVFDVYSHSPDIGLNGVPYAQW